MRVATRLAGVFCLAAAVTAEAQPAPRWTTGFNQGVSEAMIRSPDGSYIAFACPMGSAAAASVSVQRQGRAPAGPGRLRLSVDGRSFDIGLNDGFAEGRSPDAIGQAATALASSASAGFTIELPEAGWRQEFALAGAREALIGERGRTIVNDWCP